MLCGNHLNYSSEINHVDAQTSNRLRFYYVITKIHPRFENLKSPPALILDFIYRMVLMMVWQWKPTLGETKGRLKDRFNEHLRPVVKPLKFPNLPRYQNISSLIIKPLMVSLTHSGHSNRDGARKEKHISSEEATHFSLWVQRKKTKCSIYYFLILLPPQGFGPDGQNPSRHPRGPRVLGRKISP